MLLVTSLTVTQGIAGSTPVAPAKSVVKEEVTSVNKSLNGILIGSNPIIRATFASVSL